MRLVMGMMHMVILPKVLVIITKFMPIILLDMVHYNKVGAQRAIGTQKRCCCG